MPYTLGAGCRRLKGHRLERGGLISDARLLFASRTARLFAYGFLSVVLVLYLTEIGLSEQQVGLLLTLTLVGDTAISLWITTHADRIGRRRMLLAGAGLMVLAGVLFDLTTNYLLLVLAATLGVISPSGNEVGPFLSIEQASLTQFLPGQRRTGVFAWYNLVGSFATALGALFGGSLAQGLQNSGLPPLVAYRAVVAGYALIGLLLVMLFLRLSPAVESARLAAPAPQQEKDSWAFLGLHHSRRIVFRLAALFSLDAFAGGFVIQSLVAYWFHVRFGVEPALLGGIFFAANLLAGVSALSAAWVARRIGLIRTMVFTHLPSNLLLMLVPLMPSLPLAISVLLLRFSISQMDVPTRQSYTMAVVAPDERSAASGVTGVARTIGASLSPLFTGILFSNPALLSAPFLISGALKIVYDLSLYRSFRAIPPPEEK
jgi:MFS family permease